MLRRKRQAVAPTGCDTLLADEVPSGAPSAGLTKPCAISPMTANARAAAFAASSALDECAVNRRQSQGRCGPQACQGAGVRETGAVFATRSVSR